MQDISECSYWLDYFIILFYFILFLSYFHSGFLSSKMTLVFVANADSPNNSKISGRLGSSENGRLEIMAEIKLLGSDIKDMQIFCLKRLNSAYLCEDVTQGLWFHTAPLCSQPVTTFLLSASCQCVVCFLHIGLSSESLYKTHNVCEYCYFIWELSDTMLYHTIRIIIHVLLHEQD